MLRFLTICTLIASPVYAVDGVTLIDQARALAGNVTPGDTPGFPVIISLPGSYRLSSNLTVGSGGGILVTADGVTIDLNGFSITGTTGTVQGITASTFFGSINVHDTTVLNGTVRNMGGSGVVIGSRSRVENVRVLNSGFFGIAVGTNSVVRNCMTYGHAIGIQAVFSSVVGNTSANNTSTDFQVVDSTRAQNFPAP